MSPLEQAARALYAKRAEARDDWKPWDEISSAAQHILMEEARAVIEAIRMPSEAMHVAVVAKAHRIGQPISTQQAWIAMVDSLLKDAP